MGIYIRWSYTRAINKELLLVLPDILNCKSLLFVEFIVKLHPLIMNHNICSLFVLILYMI